MSTYARKLVDAEGNVICPATRTEAVYTDTDAKLSDWLTDCSSQLSTMSLTLANIESYIERYSISESTSEE